MITEFAFLFITTPTTNLHRQNVFPESLKRTLSYRLPALFWKDLIISIVCRVSSIQMKSFRLHKLTCI